MFHCFAEVLEWGLTDRWTIFPDKKNIKCAVGLGAYKTFCTLEFSSNLNEEFEASN